MAGGEDKYHLFSYRKQPHRKMGCSFYRNLNIKNNTTEWQYHEMFFIFGPLYCRQERFFVSAGSQATQWMAAGPPGVPGRSAAETAAGESVAGRGPAVTRSPSMEVRPAWGQHRSIRSATSPLVQVGRALTQTSYKTHKDTCTRCALKQDWCNKKKTPGDNCTSKIRSQLLWQLSCSLMHR